MLAGSAMHKSFSAYPAAVSPQPKVCRSNVHAEGFFDLAARISRIFGGGPVQTHASGIQGAVLAIPATPGLNRKSVSGRSKVEQNKSNS